MATKNTARKLAQRAVPVLDKCETCGATTGLSRHHTDYSRPTLVQILCGPCHVAADQREGRRRRKQPRPCVICGTPFMPRHSKKHATCSPACLSEAGRRNALKRWQARGPLASLTASRV